MANVIKKLQGTPSVSRAELIELLKTRLKAELVSETCKEFDGASITLLCLEKFFFRHGSYTAMTVLLTENGGVCTVDLTVFASGTSVANSGSLWANEDFANAAVMLLEPLGLQEVE